MYDDQYVKSHKTISKAIQSHEFMISHTINLHLHVPSQSYVWYPLTTLSRMNSDSILLDTGL